MHLEHFIEKRIPISEKWDEVKDIMATHIFGKPPTRLFKYRRPLESTNDYALKYREKNFEPITKQPFLTAIGGILEATQHVYAPEKNMGVNLTAWLDQTKIKVANKTFKFRDYVINYIGWKAESDPNGALTVRPLHPYVELDPQVGFEVPSFEEVKDEFVRLDVSIVPSCDIHYLDDEEIMYKGGMWRYKEENYAPYFWIQNKEFTLLSYPVISADKGIEYITIPWYFNDLNEPPFTIIGNNIGMYEIDGENWEYKEGTFPGGVSIMNEVVKVKSDSQIVDTRFTYPEKVAQYQACGATGCHTCQTEGPFKGLNVIFKTDGSGECDVCTTCKGTGKVAPDTSPFGTHIMVKSDMFDDDSKFIPPIQFITPPLQSAEYLDKKWRLDFAEGKKALFILDQNMTNQSGISKGYDVRQKVSVITGAVKNLFRIYEFGLNTVAGFLMEEQDVYVERPADYNVKTSSDLTVELSEAKGTASVYRSELTKELLLMKFGNDDVTQRIVTFLQIVDKFFGYDLDQIVKQKAIYGGNVKGRDQFVHDKGFNILQKIASENPAFPTMTDEKLKTLFDAEIDAIFTEVEVAIIPE